jgi:fibrillarin-like rRNA methylase
MGPVKLGWGVRREGRSLWTRNAVRGVSVRGERRKKDGRIEWRQWIPYKSKVAAALLRTKNDAADLLPEPGSTCLYLGASYGGTVSFVHDLACGSNNFHEGQIIAVEIAPRAMRELAALASRRPGLVPVLGDARLPHTVSPFIREKADWLHQDLSIADQAKTFVKMAGAFLKPEGTGLLSLKAASERSSDGDDDTRFAKAERILGKSDLEVVERIDLAGFEEQHVVFHVRQTAESG